MLIKCPECELPVSDKAVSCPHCGYPILKPSTQNYTRRKNHMRLPNGFGQITKLNRNLRNQYRVMVTVGKTELGKPICKLLKPKAYFATYNEAYEALVEYNRNPYDLSDALTMSELYDKWTAEYFKTLKSDSSERTIKAAWANCSSIYNMSVSSVRARHLKGCIESANCSANMKSRIKSVLNLMLDFAVEYELTDKNYARDFKLSDNLLEEKESNKKQHIAFSDEELTILWNHIDLEIVQWIIVQTYMGWRPQELCLLEEKNIKDGFICGGMKTQAGTNRLVPIHADIWRVIEKLEFGKYNYDTYRRAFNTCMSDLGLNPEHRPHDPRKTFVTLAKRYNVDEYAIKKIVGHNISDITEAIYTERSNEWLIEEVNKIQVPQSSKTGTP